MLIWQHFSLIKGDLVISILHKGHFCHSLLIFFFSFLYSSSLFTPSSPPCNRRHHHRHRHPTSLLHTFPSFFSSPVITLPLVTVEGRPRQGGFAQPPDLKFGERWWPERSLDRRKETAEKIEI